MVWLVLVIIVLLLFYDSHQNRKYAKWLNQKVEIIISPNWGVLRKELDNIIKELGENYIADNANKKKGLSKDCKYHVFRGGVTSGLKFLLGRNFCWNDAYQAFQEEIRYSAQIFGGLAKEAWKGEKEPFYRIQEIVKREDGWQRVIRIELMYIKKEEDKLSNPPEYDPNRYILLGDIPLDLLFFEHKDSNKQLKKYLSLLNRYGFKVEDNSSWIYGPAEFSEYGHDNFTLYIKRYEDHLR